MCRPSVGRAYDLTSELSGLLSDPQNDTVSRASPVETGRSLPSVDVGKRDSLWGRQNPELARIGLRARPLPALIRPHVLVVSGGIAGLRGRPAFLARTSKSARFAYWLIFKPGTARERTPIIVPTTFER